MRIVLAVAAMFIATPVFAAKAHREAAKEFPPKIKEAQDVVKGACGCAPAISYDKASFDKVPADKVRDFKSNMIYEFKYIGEQSKSFCNDADSKKLYCAGTKKVIVKVGEDVGAVYAERDKSFTITTTKQMNSGGYKFKEILDSW